MLRLRKEYMEVAGFEKEGVLFVWCRRVFLWQSPFQALAR